MNAPEDCFSPRQVVLIGLRNNRRNNLHDQISAILHERRCQVFSAETGPEGRYLAHQLGAGLVIVGADLPCDSARLTCAKICLDPSGPAVILVANARDFRSKDVADFLKVGYWPWEGGRMGSVPRLEFRPQRQLL